MVVLDRKRFRVLFLKALLLLTSIVISSKKEDGCRYNMKTLKKWKQKRDESFIKGISDV